MNSFFINSNNQKQFDKDGFLKLEIPLLNEKEIHQLTTFFYSSGLQQTEDFDVSKDHVDKDKVNEMMQIIEQIVLPKLNIYIKSAELFIASFLVKSPSKSNAIYPHQDETFVDDNINFSVNCWIPLVDTGVNNGCIGMIKGSHTIFNNICPTPASVSPSPLLEYYNLLIPYIEWIPVKAGEAILFNYKTVHASMPNLSNEPRIAISLWVAEKNSKYFTNYLKPGTTNKLLKYEIDRAFYVKFSDKILSEMYNANKFLEDYKLVQEDNYIWKKLIMEELEGQLIIGDNNYNKNNLLYFSGNINTKKSFKDLLLNIYSSCIRFLFNKNVN